ncbi:6-hydroxymethylpterin diphosphokinase MptE-like protein [Bacillus pinisoli]|uniref:6-hydroxymethylpterin diphosphokinase MptE-like protein n=1 Tax=Bacillus pinisoli TaxID=2901866 RepID=UPI001FF1F80C|nr:6-hydroxymethylpterin diphosphokinase MptE-like protein [Bacillus pinisoli]
MINYIKTLINNTISIIVWTTIGPFKRKLKTLFINLRVRFLSTRIRELKNIHKGESCFVIGNGPSLTVSDLNMIKSKISFSSNRISLLLDKTEWRPFYYTFADSIIASKLFNEVYKMEKEKMFVVIKNKSYKLLKKHFNKECNFLRACYDYDKNGLPKFSKDLSKKIIHHGTVTYSNIQLAVYMGFKEIYLIGVDHNYGVIKTKNGSIEYNEMLIGKDYFDEKYYKSIEENKEIPVNLYEMTEAYLSAKKHCDDIGVKIYNATRGGKLDVFPRVNFDELFNKNGEFVGIQRMCEEEINIHNAL